MFVGICDFQCTGDNPPSGVVSAPRPQVLAGFNGASACINGGPPSVPEELVGYSVPEDALMGG